MLTHACLRPRSGWRVFLAAHCLRLALRLHHPASAQLSLDEAAALLRAGPPAGRAGEPPTLVRRAGA